MLVIRNSIQLLNELSEIENEIRIIEDLALIYNCSKENKELLVNQFLRLKKGNEINLLKAQSML